MGIVKSIYYTQLMSEQTSGCEKIWDGFFGAPFPSQLFARFSHANKTT